MLRTASRHLFAQNGLGARRLSTIVCKAAVAWAPNVPLTVQDIKVSLELNVPSALE